MWCSSDSDFDSDSGLLIESDSGSEFDSGSGGTSVNCSAILDQFLSILLRYSKLNFIALQQRFQANIFHSCANVGPES